MAVDADFKKALDYHNKGFLDKATEFYRLVLDAEPLHVQSLNNLGMICFDRQDYQVSISFFSMALQVDPCYDNAIYNRGRVFHEMGDNEKAIDDYKNVLKINSSNKLALENLIALMLDEGLYDENLENCRKRLSLSEDFFSTSSYALCLYETEKYDQARLFFEKALKFNPAEPVLNVNYAHLCLIEKKYADGWNYIRQCRNSTSFLKKNNLSNIPIPQWSGENLRGKSIYVVGDQGIGDQVMYASCIVDLIKQDVSITLECDDRLVPVFERSFPGINLKSKQQGSGSIYKGRCWLDFDYQVCLSELPLWLRSSSRDFIKRPYLVADSEKGRYWGRYLKSYKGLKVGVSWSGGSTKKVRNQRSVDVDLLIQSILSSNSEITLFSLQYDVPASDNLFTEGRVSEAIVYPAEMDIRNDVDSLLSFIAELDYVITVDNCTAHFASAIGQSTHVILPKSPDWRWGLSGASDWYGDNLKLYRSKCSIEDSLKQAVATFQSQTMQTELLAEHSDGLRNNDKVLDDSHETLPGSSKVLLLNDTQNWYHWGCSCTSIAIKRKILETGNALSTISASVIHDISVFPESIQGFDDQKLANKFSSNYQSIVKLLNDSDVVVVNGEGTLHNTSKVSMSLLYIVYLAKCALNKKVFIINHSCYPDGLSDPVDISKLEVYRKVYSLVDFVSVRDRYSYKICKEFSGNVVQGFDCLPLYVKKMFKSSPIKRTEDVITVAGSVNFDKSGIDYIRKLVESDASEGYKVDVLIGSGGFIAKDDVEFVSMLADGFDDKLRLRVVNSEHEWLEQIASSSLVISGRFHHSVAAACLKTPFLLSASNTPKTKALVERLQLNASWIDGMPWKEVESLVAEALCDKGRFICDDYLIQTLLDETEANFYGFDN